MSFSNAPRRTRSPGKGASVRKKTGKKKQEFHSPKRRTQQAEELDLHKLKERTISGLDHLGHQQFSVDRSNYGMDGWVKSLSLLLEDFESKLQEGQIPPEYLSRKQELMASLSAPVDTNALDTEISKVRSEESALKAKLDSERERIAARLIEIRSENERQSKDLEAEKARLEQVKLERQKVSFFSRMLGRTGPPIEPVQARLEELSSTLKKLEDEQMSLNAARDSMERRSTESPDPYAEDWRRLNEIGEEVAKLEAELQGKLQREKERAEATDALAKLVAEVKAAPPSPDENSSEPKAS